MKNNFLKGKNIKNRFLAVSMASLILASSFPANTIAYVPMNTAMDAITQATENDENIFKELTKDANSQVLVIRDGSFTYKLKVFVNKHVNFVEGIVDETDTVNGVYGSVAMIWGQFKGENKGLKKYGGKTFGEIKAMPKPDDIIVMGGQKDEIPNKVHKKILEFIATEEAKEGKAEREKKNELARSLYKYRYRYVHKDTKIWDEVTLSQFLESYDKARTVLEKSNPSDSEISERIRDLETKYNAIKAAPFSDAKFKELVSQAEEKINNKDHYTLSTMAELERVLAEVRNDYNNGKIKNLLDMNKAEEKLQKALDQLVTKEESKRRFTIDGEILQYGNENEKSMANQFMNSSILLIEEDNAKIYEVTFKKGSFQGITAEVQGLKYNNGSSWQTASLENSTTDTKTFKLVMPKSDTDKIHIKTLAYMGTPDLAEQDAVLKLNLSTKRPEGSQLEDGNKQKLKEFLDSIQELNEEINAGLYKEPQSTEFKNKYIEATKLLEANQVTDDAIDAIIRSIRIIKQDLVLKAVDDFAQKLGKAEGITTDQSSKDKYTEKSLAKLQAAVDAGNAVWAKRYAQPKEELARLIDLLDTAMADLRQKGQEEEHPEGKVYTAAVEVMHADTPGQKSMANNAIVSPAKLIYSGDKVKVELTFKGLTIGNNKGHLTKLFYFEDNISPKDGGNPIETKVEKNFMDTGMDGQVKEFPQVFSFTIDKSLFESSDFFWCRVWVDVMDSIASLGEPTVIPGKGAQNARIAIDKTNLPKEEPLNNEELTNLINAAKAIEKGDKTEESFAQLKEAIKAAEETLKTATDQEVLNQGVAKLKAAVEAFKASPAEVKEAKNKPELEKLLQEQYSLYQDVLNGEYKEEGTKLYLDKHKEALRILEDQNASEEAIDDVIRSLKAIKQNRLVLKILDIFQDLIVKAEEITNSGNTNKKYTEDSFNKLNEAVNEANKYWHKRFEQPKEKIEALNKMLKDGLDGLKEVAKPELNKEALTKEIEAAKAIEQGKKTDEAFNTLKAAITSAEEVLNRASEQTQLDDAVTTLNKAIESFKVSPNKTIPVEDGIYTAPVRVDHAYDPGKQSMANGAIEHTAKVVYRGDKVTLELTFNGLKLWGMKGHLTNLFFYKDNKDPKNNTDAIEAEVIKTHMDLGLNEEKEFPHIFRYTMDKSVFEASDFLWVKVWVDAMDLIASGNGNPIVPGAGEQNAKIVVDKTKLEKVILNTEALTKEIETAKGIVKGKKTDEAFSKLQAAIKAAEKVLREATDQEPLDEEVKTLKAAVETFNNSPDVLEKEALIKEIEAAKAIEQGKKTEEAFNKLKEAITAAEKVLREATEQEALNQGVATLKMAVKAFNESPDKKVAPTPIPEPQPKPEPTHNYPSYPIYQWHYFTTVGSTSKPSTKNVETKSPAKEVKREAQNSKADNFTDIEGHWAKEAIKYVVNKGYFQGVSDREFAPNKGITRGQLVTVLGRILNIDKTSFKSNNFKDVKADAYYAPYVAWAESVGITKGRGNGSFDPDKEITREEMAVMMVKFLKVSGKKLNVKGTASAFKDDVNIESWAKDAVMEMAKLGLVKGVEDGSFSPKTQFTRAQVAQILYNIDKN